MKIIRTGREMRAQSDAWRREGKKAGFVPTMGAFHAGHLSLMERARGECDVVVVSLFVNPTQFNEASDLAAYPRDEDADASMARAAGVDVLFAPTAADMYPRGFATTIAVAGLEEVLEGAMRGPQHFRGVATVVAKLINVVGPDVMYLGQKDAQQVAVIKRMVTDLALPTAVAVCPTMRESDGLAMSSRNVRLKAEDRERALALRHGLDAAVKTIDAGERDAKTVERLGVEAMSRDGVTPEYFALVDAESLAPLSTVTGNVLIAVAARVGPVRLIDNESIEVT